MRDQVICLRDSSGQPVWKAVLAGKIIPAEWPDKGSAEAGLATERRRLLAKTEGKP
jgi:hypothetical protein